jgi:signal transduction histidine kinase
MTTIAPSEVSIALAIVQEAIQAIESAEQSRRDFIARMNHELRTPLNCIIGFTKVLEKNRAGNQRAEDIQMISRVRASGEQLLRLVEDVLEHSRIERGELSLNLDETDVVDIAWRVIERFRHAAVAKGLRLIALLPYSVPMIRLDAERFERVLEHLVDNAIKFTDAGSIRVSLVKRAQSDEPARVVVTDTGIGIPADQLPHIFQPFEQVDGSLSRRAGGAGIGLSIARELCLAMGCELTATSQVGQGSRFAIVFPETAVSL